MLDSFEWKPSSKKEFESVELDEEDDHEGSLGYKFFFIGVPIGGMYNVYLHDQTSNTYHVGSRSVNNSEFFELHKKIFKNTSGMEQW